MHTPTHATTTTPARSTTTPAPFGSSTARTGPVRSTPLLRSLDAEWERLRHRPGPLREMRSWPERLPADRFPATLRRVVHTARSIDDVVDATHRVDRRRANRSVDADELLAALVHLATAEELAARIVVQRLISGVVRGARKWITGRPEDAIDHAVTTCWIAIHRFDVDRRPRFIANALVLDVIWFAFRSDHRRRANEPDRADVPVEDLCARAVVRHPLVELASVVREAERAGVETTHVDLVRDLVATGSTAAVAERWGVTARTIRNRRRLAESRIRDALAIGAC